MLNYADSTAVVPATEQNIDFIRGTSDMLKTEYEKAHPSDEQRETKQVFRNPLLASMRGESELEFIDNARRLEEFTIKKVVKFPKKYSEYIAHDLVNFSQQIYCAVRAANKFPACQKDVAERKEKLEYVILACEQMAAQLDIIFNIIASDEESKMNTAHMITEWSTMLSTEIRCVAGIIKSDETRFKNLP